VNLNKLRAKEQGLNGQARKVYDALQIQTSMTVREVMQGMYLKGFKPDHSIVQGCLAELVEQGLARSPLQGRYQRVAPTSAVVSNSSVAQPIYKKLETTTPMGTIDVIKQKLICASDQIAEAVGLLDTLESEQAKKLEAAQEILNVFDRLDELRKK
jgi:hypothetical protein